MIISYLLEKGSITEESLKLFRPSICNRLDRNTSGIILAAKTPKGARFLSKIIKDRSLRKYYLAVVPRKPAKLGHFTAYLSKDESSNKVTIYNKKTDGAALIETDVSLIEYNPKTETSLLSIELITGKSHQIRAHLASLRMPIIGDIKYGSEITNEMYKKNYGVKSQLLSAYKVEFPESADSILSGKVFYAKPPHSFDNFIIRKDIISGNLENQRS
jgi:23S rRNA pseudouridine955/2504/2580 synthase